ncbi:MAG TPA: hypothetical protein PK977_02810 [Chitinophagaceae bacterium]|nr:hypothetical protein [Chitinophagaceae bacterium]
MKHTPYSKALLWGLFNIFSLLLLLIACNKKTEKEVFRLPDEIIISETVTRHPDLSNILGKKIKGEAIIFQLNSGEMIITIKSPNETEALNKFILQTKKTESYKTELIKIKNAELVYLFDIVLLNDLDKNKLSSYYVNSATYKETYASLPALVRSSIETEIPGYGLGYNKGSWPGLNENISLNNSVHTIRHLSQNIVDGGDGGGTTCTSGGVGSTSCSLANCFTQGCSVSCGAGYYACCYCDDVLPDLGPSCTCKENPPGGGGPPN